MFPRTDINYHFIYIQNSSFLKMKLVSDYYYYLNKIVINIFLTSQNDVFMDIVITDNFI